MITIFLISICGTSFEKWHIPNVHHLYGMLHPSTPLHIYDAACADRFVRDWYFSGFVIHTWCISLNFNEIAHFEMKKNENHKVVCQFGPGRRAKWAQHTQRFWFGFADVLSGELCVTSLKWNKISLFSVLSFFLLATLVRLLFMLQNASVILC